MNKFQKSKHGIYTHKQTIHENNFILGFYFYFFKEKKRKKTCWIGLGLPFEQTAEDSNCKVHEGTACPHSQ